MIKSLFLMILLWVVLIAGCSTDTPDLPNPASVYCEEQGGNVDIRTNPDGSQTGYCVFSDGSECEEWDFYRGECEAGEQ